MKLTELTKEAQGYASKEATLLADIRRTSKYLEQAKKNHHAYVGKSYHEISKLQEEVRLPKVQLYLATKELEKVMNNFDILCNQVENSKTKLAIVESILVEASAPEAKII